MGTPRFPCPLGVSYILLFFIKKGGKEAKARKKNRNKLFLTYWKLLFLSLGQILSEMSGHFVSLWKIWKVSPFHFQEEILLEYRELCKRRIFKELVNNDFERNSLI